MSPIDYRDSTGYDKDLYRQFRTPAGRFPADLRDSQVETRADARLTDAATALHLAFAAADPAAAAAVLHPDVVYDSTPLGADRRRALVLASGDADQ